MSHFFDFVSEDEDEGIAQALAINFCGAAPLSILFIIPPPPGLLKDYNSTTGYFLWLKIGISIDFISSTDFSLFLIYPKKAVCYDNTEYLQETWTI